MKKLLLFLVALVLITSQVQAQSFTISGVTIVGDPQFFLEGHAEISNTSNSPKSLMVQKVVNNLFPGHHSYFCLVQCYDTATVFANDTLLMPALSVTGHGGIPPFLADLETNSASGISIVSYCFYDPFNVSDSACVEYIYDATTGIQIVPGNQDFISNAFPSPATGQTNLYYRLSPGTKSASIRLFNMLGAEIQAIELTDQEGTVTLSLSGWEPGLYYYALSSDGKTRAGGRFTVAADLRY